MGSYSWLHEGQILEGCPKLSLKPTSAAGLGQALGQHRYRAVTVPGQDQLCCWL